MMRCMTRLAVAAVLTGVCSGANILYGGVVMKVEVPLEGAVIRGSFEPSYSVTLMEGVRTQTLTQFWKP